MDNNSLKLCSLFSYSPNSKGYCGQTTASAAFQKCIEGSDCMDAMREFSHFITLYPYLKTISRVRNLNTFDYKVVEAYWIGNDLLSDFPIEGYQILLEEFDRQGVPSWLIKNLRTKVPKTFTPHHLFQVIHVGVGQASGSVPFCIESINNCMIRFGKITKVTDQGYEVVLNELTQIEGGYKLVEKSNLLSKESPLFCKPTEKDSVAIHWGQIVKVLTPSEAESLSHWTREIIRGIQ